MMKMRQDAWLEENDELLAQAVLRHVKEGSTQLNAFEEASDLLQRTAAACGFRWNAVVRKLYEDQLAEAKQQRKERIRMLGAAKRRQTTNYYQAANQTATSIPIDALSIDIVIAFLLRLQQGQTTDHSSIKWRHIAEQHIEKTKQLSQQITQLQQQNAAIKSDYEQFVQIMDRARKMVVLDNEEERLTPAFKMERNGNLVPATNFIIEEKDNLL